MLRTLIIRTLIVANAVLLGISLAFRQPANAFAYTLFTLFWSFAFIRLHTGRDAAPAKVSPWK